MKKHNNNKKVRVYAINYKFLACGFSIHFNYFISFIIFIHLRHSYSCCSIIHIHGLFILFTTYKTMIATLIYIKMLQGHPLCYNLLCLSYGLVLIIKRREK